MMTVKVVIMTVGGAVLQWRKLVGDNGVSLSPCCHVTVMSLSPCAHIIVMALSHCCHMTIMSLSPCGHIVMSLSICYHTSVA